MSFGDGNLRTAVRDLQLEIERLKAERVEVVRCRDCKYYRESDATCHSWQWHNWDAAIEVDADCFCAWGERHD